jgi:branched-chain amino acid transport system ATP-binding protein
MSAVLAIEAVHTVYGKTIRALKGVSLEVHTGEIVCLIGNNGAGKTTLLKTVSGILKPESGAVRFEDRSIGGLPAHEIARLGLAHVPEGRHIFPRLTVLENLEMGAYNRSGLLTSELDHVYGLFPVLGERRKQLGGTLSGGEQQMLAIGRALMARPKLLMLDEPSMGLAPVLVDRIFEIIKKINAEGTTILLVEQNARKALSVGSRAYVLETGTIVLADQAARLLDNPQVRQAYLGLHA